jgi:hypothetical protein
MQQLPDRILVAPCLRPAERVVELLHVLTRQAPHLVVAQEQITELRWVRQGRKPLQQVVHAAVSTPAPKHNFEPDLGRIPRPQGQE